jgi:probable phosphoglycerate mutase
VSTGDSRAAAPVTDPRTAATAAETRTVLYLVRHGEADSNRNGRIGGWSPAPLTELGHRQAARAAAELVRRGPTVLVASDLERARQTAAPIAAATGLVPRYEPGLRERSLGVLDGLPFDEARTRHPELWQRMLARDVAAIPEGGESHDAVHERITGAIARLVREHPGERIAVVTHGLALYHVFTHLCGLGCPAAAMPVFVLVDNASITHVEHRAYPSEPLDRWRIVTVNDTAHLRGLEHDAPPPV